MFIQGAINPSLSVRSFLETEHAFSVLYKTGIEIRVGHWKGAWYVVRLKNGQVTGGFTYYDNGDVTTEDLLTRRMVEEIESAVVKENKDLDMFRLGNARALERIFRIYGGRTEDITLICVVQPGRNAMVNMETGEFELAPRVEEFFK